MVNSILKKLKDKSIGNQVIIRQARIDDINTMTGLLSELFNIETDFAPNIRRQRQGLADLMNSREATLLVAVAGDEIIGMCTLQPLISTAEGGKVGLVEDLVVAASYRKSGVGRKLLKEIEATARSQGMSRLQLLSDRNNKAASTFYDHLGWATTSMIAYRKKL
ncbi:MAG: GNAT family N-acetyltransferase [Mariprofundaceae bacterium]|nr:GNAT family N-acetyltransferase [Mariprofundaceae bacterium]